MKIFFAVLLIISFNLSTLYANEDSTLAKANNCTAGNLEKTPVYECGGLFPSDSVENNDPFEPINRAIFGINLGIEYVLIEPIAWAYSEVLPEDARDRISYILRNLNEPIVLVNNLLQGDLESARGTIWRFVLNSTLGMAGIFDVSTDLGFPYKKEDLGLTFASWGAASGPYLVLPILGPSNIRDAWGRLGDYAFDPINWLTFGMQSTSRSAVQVLDAKTDNLQITDDIKKNAVDHYASIRTWYTERRKDLMIADKDRQAIDTPRPDENEEETPRSEDDEQTSYSDETETEETLDLPHPDEE